MTRATTTRSRLRSVALLVVVALVAAGCLPEDVRQLSSDRFDGRAAGTVGGQRARDYLVTRLQPLTQGLNPAGRGRAAYHQRFPGGTNVVAMIPGTDRADEYVVIGAHYDHLGRSCPSARYGDHICNGATDNATGVAEVLEVAERLARRPARRTVVFALWDGEEQGLLGSTYFVKHPLVSLDRTVAYVNLDIQGANLTPSLAPTTFAVGAETGGTDLVGAVRQASRGPLTTVQLSAIFGGLRSDYAPFLEAKVPSVFFTDSTGRCYHTAQDEFSVVDLKKLDHQTDTAERLVRSLADAPGRPLWQRTPVATYDDAVAFLGVIDRSRGDRRLFSAADLATIDRVGTDLRRIQKKGRAAFTRDDQGRLLTGAEAAVEVLTHGRCTGFPTGT